VLAVVLPRASRGYFGVQLLQSVRWIWRAAIYGALRSASRFGMLAVCLSS